MFEKPKRLSTYVQIEHPEKMTEIAIKLADQLMLRLEGKRELLEIRNIYVFFIMYSLWTKDLYLFSRIFVSLENLKGVAHEAIQALSECENKNSSKLFGQLFDFYSEQKTIFNVPEMALSKTIENNSKFHEIFMDSCYVVAEEYLEC